MQNSAADHHVGEAIRKRHPLDGFYADIFCRQLRRKLCSEPANGVDGVNVGIGCEDVEARLQQIDQISPAAAGRVQHAHTGADAPAQKLIE